MARTTITVSDLSITVEYALAASSANLDQVVKDVETKTQVHQSRLQRMRESAQTKAEQAEVLSQARRLSNSSKFQQQETYRQQAFEAKRARMIEENQLKIQLSQERHLARLRMGHGNWSKAMLGQLTTIATGVKAFALAWGAMQFKQLIVGSLSAVDSLADQADALNLTVEELYAYQRALMDAGRGADELQKLVTHLATAMTQPTKEQTEFFAKHGIDATSMQSVTEMFDAIIQRVRSGQIEFGELATVVSKRSAVAFSALAKTIESTNDARDKYKIPITDEEARRIDQLREKWFGLKLETQFYIMRAFAAEGVQEQLIKLAADLGEAVKKIDFVKVAEGLDTFVRVSLPALQNFANAVNEILYPFRKVIDAFEWAKRQASSVGAAFAGAGDAAYESSHGYHQSAEAIEAAGKAAEHTVPWIHELAEQVVVFDASVVGGIRKTIAARDKEIAQIEKEIRLFEMRISDPSLPTWQQDLEVVAELTDKLSSLKRAKQEAAGVSTASMVIGFDDERTREAFARAFEKILSKPIEVPVEIFAPSAPAFNVEEWAKSIQSVETLDQKISRLDSMKRRFAFSAWIDPAQKEKAQRDIADLEADIQRLVAVQKSLTPLEQVQQFFTEYSFLISRSIYQIQDLADAWQFMNSVKLDNEIMALEATQERERERWQERSEFLREAGLENSALYRNEARAQAVAEKSRENEMKKLKAKAWEDDKKARLASVLMSTAQAVINAWTVQPVWLAPIMAALAAAAGVMQYQAVQAQKNPYRMRVGGWVPGDGGFDRVPVVATGGEFVVERQTAKRNADALEFMARGGTVAAQGGNVHVHFHGPIVGTNDWIETELLPALKKAQRNGYTMSNQWR